MHEMRMCVGTVSMDVPSTNVHDAMCTLLSTETRKGSYTVLVMFGGEQAYSDNSYVLACREVLDVFLPAYIQSLFNDRGHSPLVREGVSWKYVKVPTALVERTIDKRMLDTGLATAVADYMERENSQGKMHVRVESVYDGNA